MPAITDIRARIRLRLEETIPAMWSDAELDEVITATLEQYNERFPRESTTSIGIDGSTVAVPAGARSILRVALESGVIVPRRGEPLGNTSDERLAWESFAGTIWLTRPLPAQMLTVWYLSAHQIDEVPEADTGLLVLGGVWRALEQRGVQEAKRSGPVAGPSFGLIVQRAREEFERAFDSRARRLRVILQARE